jgi:hypothetical protein
LPLYTLYPRHPDGSSDTFLSLELTDDGEARIEALRVLQQHPTASYVDVWRGDRKVHTRARVQTPAQEVLGRISAL